MLAFHSDPTIKKTYLNRVAAHRKADEIIKGKYWEGGKGCAVGCTIHSDNHQAYETELGIPTIIARLEDRIFEGLPLKLAKTWPERFLKAIKPGADLSRVWDEFASRLLTDSVGGVIQYAKTPEQLEVIQRVSDLYEARIAGLDVDPQEFEDARKAAFYAAAAVNAADAADAAYAAYAAFYAAYAAAFYAADAAYAADAVNAAFYAAAAAAVNAADAAASRENAYVWQSELLLELLRGAK